MDPEHWRPLDLARSWRAGVQVAAGTTAVVGLSLVIGDVRSVAAWGLVAVSAVLAGLARLVQHRDVVVTERGWLLQYLWSIGGLVATGVLTLAVGDGPLRFAFVFMIAAVAAGISYPPRGRSVHQAVVLGVVVATWAVARPFGIGPAELLLFLGLFGVLLYLIGALSRDLRTSLVEENRISSTVADRNRLLGMVGRAVSLDADRALNIVVDAVVACGFEIANVAVIRDGVRHVVATHGIAAPTPPAPAFSGIAGRALAEDRTVVVDDYQSAPERLPHRGAVRSAVVAPIRIDWAPVGVLVGARTEPGTPTPDDIEMLEMLAVHAGHAIAAARRFEEEQDVVTRLRELDRMKRDFVSNASHELRTPLTVVKGLGRTLGLRGDSLGSHQADELLDRINANAERLGAMLDGLLDFSRPESDALRVQRRPVELCGLVRVVVSRFSPVLERHLLRLVLPPSAVVVADPTLVEHVLENLLSNVVKHTPPGTAVVVEAAHADAHVHVSVRDQGPGIPSSEIPELTRRYYRGGQGDARESEGAGVGLALVQDILEAHGTRLEISSAEGSGSVFTFALPAATEVST